MSADDVWQLAFFILKSCRNHFQELVTIVVGSAKKDFTVHKELLVFYSGYFRAAFNGSFVEAAEKKIELLDIEANIFEEFHAWLYTRKIASEDGKNLKMLDLVNLWIFGDRFQVPMLQNHVMDAIFIKEESERVLDAYVFKVAYEKTVKGSLLRKALIEILAYRLNHGNDDCTSSMADRRHAFYTVEILADLVKELNSARINKVAYGLAPKRDKCFFHVHGKDEHC